MKRMIGFLLLGIMLLSACRSSVDDRLENALDFAGDNRAELEKVLVHYKNDSLKLLAAKFLIENMPAYYTYKGTLLDSMYIALAQYADSSRYDEHRFAYLKQFSCKQLEQEFDAKVITATYLIENIDYSFKVWEQRPWGKYISFDDFCEFLLPYRVSNEPLTHWKKELYERFTPVLDSLYTGTDVVSACDAMNTYLIRKGWRYFSGFNGPHVSAPFLVDKRVGSCNDLCDYTVYVMRSVGIPVSTDIYLYSPELAYYHAWNAVLDTTGATTSFSFDEHTPIRGKNLMRKKGKAYRLCYGLQQTSWHHYLKDVSAQYFPSNQANVACEFVENGDQRPVWLAIFTDHGWKPIGGGEYLNGTALFRDIEPGLIYMALYSKDDRLTTAGYPFKIDKGTGNVVYYRPDGQASRIILTRKYPLTKNVKTFMKRMAYGRFEGANRSDFSDAELLYQLGDDVNKVFNEVSIQSAKKYRYVRYLSDKRYPADIAEMCWYEKGGDGHKLPGKLFHTAAYNNTDCAAIHAIDDNPLTYFSSAKTQGWIGLDLGVAKCIERISYVPRNDDNFIRVGDRYELFYFSSEGWKSLGCQRADSAELIYDNAPRHAVFWLKNLTRGKEEQLFSYYDEKQHFNYDTY
ncbi:transglutaminase domain-containing protein [Bacteroides sp.]|uniref:transglutaminase domain-containing protein n=1 Tax=Bacteroides sp. TaxID=29523 RepID=UPI002FC70782